MKLKSCLSGVVLAAAMLGTAHAQFLDGLSVSPASAKAGEPVTITVSMAVLSTSYCGFIVFFGDGSSVDGVVDVQKPPPFVTTHTYAKPGQYSLSVGGRSVESHPNCAGPDKTASVTVTEVVKPVVAAAPPVPAKPAAPVKAAPTAATVCAETWKVVPKTFSAKTGAYSCSAKAGTALPKEKSVCPGDLTYFENIKKGQYGCRP